jgi:hypothetical protein
MNVPGRSVNLEFKSDAIDTTNPLRPDLQSKKMVLVIDLRLCLRGEKRTASFACEVCPQNSFSVKNFTDSDDKAVCNKCPEGAVCMGGAQMGPDVSHWRLDQYTETVYECLNDKACLGALTEEDGKFDYKIYMKVKSKLPKG